MDVSRAPVELLEKSKPRQERAKRTYESILDASAQLLVEVGVERISTNLIADKAGVTVPALYRYFPNKYAVLYALGAVLMDRQNHVCQAWFEAYTTAGNPLDLLDNIYELLRSTYDVTREQTGGLEIIQSLRAVGPLQELRLESHRLVAGKFSEVLAQLLDVSGEEPLMIPGRVTVDTGYSIVEMALEDNSIPADETLRQGARMIGLYWKDVLAQNYNL